MSKNTGRRRLVAQKQHKAKIRQDCPHPMKRLYLTRSEARKVAKTGKSAGQALREYRCKCGFYHLTSGPGAQRPQPTRTDAGDERGRG